MYKVSALNGAIAYAAGAPFARWLVALIPLGYGLHYYIEGPFIAYLAVTPIGLAGFFVGAFSERLVVDAKVRAIECSKSFLGKTMRAEFIPFGAVKGIRVLPHFERSGSDSRLQRTGGARVLLEWQANWNGGGVTVTFDNEEEARAEAEQLATLFGMTVSYEQA